MSINNEKNTSNPKTPQSKNGPNRGRPNQKRDFPLQPHWLRRRRFEEITQRPPRPRWGHHQFPSIEQTLRCYRKQIMIVKRHKLQISGGNNEETPEWGEFEGWYLVLPLIEYSH